ncbi:MAG: hypothetical protein R3C02_23230 [Planctomycetaceae bacterium]
MSPLLPRGDVLYVSGQAEQGDPPTATRETLREWGCCGRSNIWD